MNHPLRPMTLGEILDRTAELYRTNFLLFAGISTIFAAAMLAIRILYLRSLMLMGYPNLMAGWRWTTAATAVAEILVIMLLAGLAIAANNRAVAWVYLDQPATIHAAAKSVLPRIRRYIWLMTNVFLRAWTPLAVLYIAYFVLLVLLLPHDLTSNPAAAQTAARQDPTKLLEFGIGILVLAPLMLAATAYGVLMSLRYSLAVPACVVEGLTARGAIRRSIELSKGSRGRIFVLGLLVGAVRIVLGIVFGFPMIALAFKHPGHALPFGWMLLEQLGEFISNALIGPIYAIGLTLFYYDQRIRKEGFDIEWMMQAAGLTQEAGLPAPQ